MQQKSCPTQCPQNQFKTPEVMNKAESLLYVSLGSSPEGAPSLGTTQNGITRCKRAVFQGHHNKFKIPEICDQV